MRSLFTATILALVTSYAAGRIGVGPCPTVPLVSNGFKTGGSIADGKYHLMRLDSQFHWGWSTFEKNPGETLNCQSA
jgi:hypothetical protein